jgi:septum formation protein
MSDQRPRLLLASASPRRKELLAMFGWPFTAVTSDADERVPGNPTPDQLVETLALRKATAVLERVAAERQDTIVIGADTVVVLDGSILGKPHHPEQAVAMLERLQGRSHDVYTGLCTLAVDADGNVSRRLGHSVTRVTLRPLTRAQIEAYVATGEPLDKAGAYGIQGLGSTLVTRIEGDYFTVVGLPLYLLSDFLNELGWPLLVEPNQSV